MILTTVGLAQSIRRGWPIALLAHVDHPDGAVAVWSGIGVLEHEGTIYEGVGRLGGISGVGGSLRLAVREIAFDLAGVPPEASESLNARVRGREARAWIAGLTADGARVNGAAWPIVAGICDTQTLEAGEDGTARLRLRITEPVFAIERAQNLAFTPEWLNARFPDSPDRLTGLDLVSGLASKSVSWTLT
jgi:hypothetical protein